jgi:hypothetical protein
VIFYLARQRQPTPPGGAYTYSGRRDVGQVGGDTWGVDNIVQSQLGDERRGLEEEGQRLLSVSKVRGATALGDCVLVQFHPRHRRQLLVGQRESAEARLSGVAYRL